jgi:hypothetical protein
MPEVREQLHRHRTLREICDKDMGNKNELPTHRQNRRSQRIAIMPACYCTYSNCKGQLVDDKTRKRHERMDLSEKFHSDSKVCRIVDTLNLLNI